MTDKVQKIKDWISKEQDGLMNAQGNFEYPEHEGAYHILCNLDTYIDSLQEEPSLSNKQSVDEAMAEIERKAKLFTEANKGKTSEEILAEMRGEEPVSEDLKTELNKYIKDHFTIDKEQLDRFGIEEKDYMYSMDKSDMLAMVHHFVGKHQEPVSEDFDALDQLLAKYAIDFSYKGKTLKECSGRYKAEIIETVNHLEPVSEDLEEASLRASIIRGQYIPKEYLDEYPYDAYAQSMFKRGAKWQKEKEYTCYEEAFEDGAKWKKEQMMANAIDGEVLENYDGKVLEYDDSILDEKLSNCKVFDKVKIIIIKKY